LLLLLLLQVYTIVTATLDNSSPPGRTAVCELLEKLQEPVAYMQELFQPISSRVSQVGLRAVAQHAMPYLHLLYGVTGRAHSSCCIVPCHACICKVMSGPSCLHPYEHAMSCTSSPCRFAHMCVLKLGLRCHLHAACYMLVPCVLPPHSVLLLSLC
jgi:hypothetical protein